MMRKSFKNLLGMIGLGVVLSSCSQNALDGPEATPRIVQTQTQNQTPDSRMTFGELWEVLGAMREF